MAQCKQCGKKGFFLLVNSDGICSACEKKNAEEAKVKAEEAKKWEPRPYHLRENDWYLTYSYRNVPIDLIFSDPFPGAVDLRAESSGEVSVLYKEVKISTISDNSKARMVSDFLNRGEMVKAQLDSKSSLYLGFYKQLLKAVENNESMVFKIVKTAKKDTLFDVPRYENLEDVSNGDLLHLEYDDESESYIVKDFADGELGELSKSDSKKLMKQEDDGIDFSVFATECDINDNDRPIAKVIVYFK